MRTALEGVKSGYLTVDERIPAPEGKSAKRGPWYRCTCRRCGNTNYTVTSGDLRTGRITSCGCYRNSQEFADTKVVHGQRRQNKGETSRAYTAWCDMKKRCDNATAENYKWYGGKGITYSGKWSHFEYFYADMGDCPPGFELDRLDSTKNYEQGNCQWIDGAIHARKAKPRHAT